MSDYNLSGLNPRDFEHLVQSLCQESIAKGITPFGDGPDGGREATFSGIMNYPSLAEPWDGYLVVQCKFRARPNEDGGRDAKWALKQLEGEFLKYKKSKRRKIPEYYLFVSNVVLSGVPKTGGKDLLRAALAQFASKHDLKGFDVWDYDKLCRLLDSQTSIRSAYAGFISTGDVLSAVIQSLPNQERDFTQMMSSFLQREVRADQFARLEQAGQSVDHKVSLSNVFVDLPAADQPYPDRSDDLHSPNDVSGIVAEILDAGRAVLRASHRARQKTARGIEQSPEPGRFVIVGGPGNGKSTVGQFVCQLHRVALLKDLPPAQLSPEARDVVHMVSAECAATKLQLPSARRFPIRIVLEQYATFLSKNVGASLLSYVVDRIAKQTGLTCTNEDMRRWLTTYPWLIVLDGLDEVPPTSNRLSVLESISGFWSDVAVLDGDVLVVATTRPQGYNDAFSPRYYHHRYLVPFLRAEALSYAERLAAARFAAEPERRVKVISRLESAWDQPSTRRLMTTPLQVTIMATLVDRVGQPPQERWRLFNQYYEVIYQRETERDITTSHVLRSSKSDVDSIHRRVGLLLHSEAETGEGHDSRLEEQRLKGLVVRQLEEEGFEGLELQTRATQMIHAAMSRLVFLVGLESDRVGFEIRSLQEFMAAEALMDAEDALVRDRLAAVAPIDHWRNVFLFASGRCFADRRFLRDAILTICEQLNEPLNDRLNGACLAGSRLALDILLDGSTLSQPKYSRSLIRLALRLLDLEDLAIHLRLATAYHESLDAIFREEIDRRLMLPEFVSRHGSWIVLLSLVERGIQWAEAMARDRWPGDPSEQVEALEDLSRPFTNAWLAARITELIPKLRPSRAHRLVRRSKSSHAMGAPTWLTALAYLVDRGFENNDTQIVVFPGGAGGGGVTCRITRISEGKGIGDVSRMPAASSEWTVCLAAARFASNPDKAGLARELRSISSVWNANAATYIDRFPWPFAACLAASETGKDLIKLAETCEKGGMGDVDDWEAAEERWVTQGVHESDWTTEPRPFGSDIATAGFPVELCQYASNYPADPLGEWRKALDRFHSLPTGPARDRVGGILCQLVGMTAILGWHATEEQRITVEPELIREIANTDARRRDVISGLSSLALPERIESDWAAVLDWLGRSKQVVTYTADPQPELARKIADAYEADRSRVGLLAILAALATSETKPPSVSLPTSDTLTSDELRWATLLLSVVKEATFKDGGLSFAERLITFASSTPYRTRSAFTAMRNAQVDPSIVDSIALELATKVRGRSLAWSDVVVSELNNQLALRKSPLLDPERWRSLKLPKLN